MALATSYLEKHDNDALKFGAYRLNVNSIAKTLAVKTAYWKQGAERVKSRYQQALGLNLVTDDNKSVLKNYIADSETLIKQLSSQDLSNPDVQQMGINIFKNLFEDEDLVGEDYTVGALQKEQALGETFRSKDGGKNYNPFSVQNIQAQQTLLKRDNKRDSWKKIYNDLEQYTPYEDTSEEYNRILKNLQAEENQTANLEGGDWYIRTNKTKGVSKERIKAAIDELGSPQLKQQMRVEGRNTFYNKLLSDPTSVDAYYQGQATNLFNRSLVGLGNQKAELEYALFLTPDDKKYASRKNAITEQIKKTEETISTIKNKTLPDYLKSLNGLSNLDNLSSSLKKIDVIAEQLGIDNAAAGLAYQSEIENIEENPAKIAQENIALSTLRYNETVRHNKATEALQALRIQDDSEGEGGLAGRLKRALPQDTRLSTDDATDLGDKMYTALSLESVTNDSLGQGFIGVIVGPNAWNEIQSGVQEDKKLGEISGLQYYDLQEMAKFLKAYDQGQVLPLGLDGLFSGSAAQPKSIDDVVGILKGMQVSTFKQGLSGILANPDYVKDVVGKLYEKDPQKVDAFTTLYDIRRRDEANTSSLINRDVIRGLGDYAQYFPSNSSKFIVNDRTIEQAYNKIPANRKMQYFVDEVEGYDKHERIVTRQVTKAEYDDIRSRPTGGFAHVEEMTLSDFKNEVEGRTKKALVDFHRTNLGKVVSIGFATKDVQEKAELVTMLSEAAVLGTDRNSEATNLVNYINSHQEDIVSADFSTPILGELPRVKVRVKVPTITANDQSGLVAEKVNEHTFEVASTLIPEKLWQKSNPTSSLTIRGARILRSELPGGATFEILNDGSGGKLEPLPVIKDAEGNIIPYTTFINPKTNNPIQVTAQDILIAIGATKADMDNLPTEATRLQTNLSSLMNRWKLHYK